MIYSFEKQAANARPCPFCGSDVIKVTSKEFFDEKNCKTVIVVCDGCDCQMQGHPYGDYEGAFESAMEAWNRRAYEH